MFLLQPFFKNVISSTWISDYIYYILHKLSNNNQIKINWRVGKKKDKFVILDIVIEGISLAVTQRSEFVSVIEQNNGEVDSLISLLKEKI